MEQLSKEEIIAQIQQKIEVSEKKITEYQRKIREVELEIKPLKSALAALMGQSVQSKRKLKILKSTGRPPLPQPVDASDMTFEKILHYIFAQRNEPLTSKEIQEDVNHVWGKDYTSKEFSARWHSLRRRQKKPFKQERMLAGVDPVYFYLLPAWYMGTTLTPYYRKLLDLKLAKMQEER